MIEKESLNQFNARRAPKQHGIVPVYVSRIEDHNTMVTSVYRRRDFYKIMLFENADGAIKYADKKISVTDRSLVLTNSMVAYKWEGRQDDVKGFLCVFTTAFISVGLTSGGVSDTALFKPGAHPVIFATSTVYAELVATFENLLKASMSGYKNKYDLMRNYIQIILHYALQLSTSQPASNQGSAYQRITDQFFALLEKQFLISSTHNTIPLKNAGEFADKLGIHTNHLNKALRGFTGKTTTQHIAERLTREAKALLINSDLTIPKIAASLGFNHASNFHIFFKQQTGYTPHKFKNGGDEDVNHNQ